MNRLDASEDESHLSECRGVRLTAWRKAMERQKQRLGGEARQFFLSCERPAASSAC
jgi:hypothetical protein